MNTEAIRNTAFRLVEARLTGAREAIYRNLVLDGPATTRGLADRLRMSILTVRPRVTELVQLGLVRLAAKQSAPGEGCYEAIPLDLARRDHEARRTGLPVQSQFRFGA